MAQWIRHSERRLVPSFSYNFDRLDTPGAGWGFPCSAEGVITLNPEHLEIQTQSLALARAGVADGTVREVGLVDYSHYYFDPGSVRCDYCGREVELSSSWANECQCGREYNGFGQGLAPRSQWGDVGEDYTSDADLLGPDPDEVPMY